MVKKGKRLFAFMTCALVILFASPEAAFCQHFADAQIVFPVVAPRLSSRYGKRKHPIYRSIRHHKGVDLQAPENSHVRAIATGTVIFADSHAGYGKLVTIQHKDGYQSLYGHLSELQVNVGDKVNAGGLIGRVGKTGRATGYHLHFEWRHEGKALDPLKVFPSLAEKAEG